MIIGIGSDIIKNSRIETLLITNKQRFLQRIFTSVELDLSKKITHPKRKIGYIAKRFAAKEAFSKALGTGIGKTLSFKDIAISSNEYGSPYFSFSNKLSAFIEKNYGKVKAHLSMTDEEEYSHAYVILEKIG